MHGETHSVEVAVVGGGPAGLTAAVALAAAGVETALGDGALLYATAWGVPVRDEPRYPPAAALVALAADRIRARAASEALTPLYLRRPDAAEPRPPKPVS